MDKSFKYTYLWIFLFIILFLSGCGSHHKKSTLPEKSTESVKSQDHTTIANPPRVEDVIQQAETYYQKGLEYYRNGNWDSASKEFEQALRTLTDADTDSDTHYKLERIYQELSLKIHLIQEQAVNSKLTRASNPSESQNNQFISSPEALPSSSIAQTTVNQTQEPLTIFGAPVELNEKIQEWINLYSRKKGDSNFLRGLERSAKYLPMIKKVFAAYDLPLDLAYIPLVESSFSNDAVSPSGAVGMWQFVRSTARNYGLQVDKWVDERKDPVKSTQAAAKYLRDLYRMLGSWDLVIAAYNSGEYKIHNAIGRYRTRNFNELSNTGYLGSETQNYVPMLKAAIILANNPNEYGLYPTYETPLAYEANPIPVKNLPVTTTATAKSSSKKLSAKELLATVDFSNQKELDTAYQSLTTIPQPKMDEFGKERSKSFSGKKREFVVYQIQKGDDLRKVAAKFNVSMIQLIMWNNLNNTNLSPNNQLKVWSEKPVNQDLIQTPPDSEGVEFKTPVNPSKSDRPVKKATSFRIRKSAKNKIVYAIKKGDNLWQLSQNFNVDVNLLKKWNKLSSGERLMPGDKLVIHLNQPLN
jgi:membrane-bound lytic murein transglycosylase D